MSDDLVFVDALPGETVLRGAHQTRRSDALAQLRKNKGRWARWIFQSAHPKLLRNQLGSDFEIARRAVDGKIVTFVRFVGTSAAPLPAGGIVKAPTLAFVGDERTIRCPANGCRVHVLGPSVADVDAAKIRHRCESPTCDQILKRQSKQKAWT